MKYVNKATIGVLVVGLRQKKKNFLSIITASKPSHSSCGRFVVSSVTVDIMSLELWTKWWRRELSRTLSELEPCDEGYSQPQH